VVFTTHLMAELSKEELLVAFVQGLAEVQKFTGPDLKEFHVAGKRVWVDDNGADLTFMFPEDY
jgi:hypothetical protein